MYITRNSQNQRIKLISNTRHGLLTIDQVSWVWATGKKKIESSKHHIFDTCSLMLWPVGLSWLDKTGKKKEKQKQGTKLKQKATRKLNSEQNWMRYTWLFLINLHSLSNTSPSSKLSTFLGKFTPAKGWLQGGI